MHRRALHLASVLLLFATLSSAEAAVLRNGEYTVAGHYLVALMAQQDHASACALGESAPGAGGKLELNLAVAAASHCRAAWTMRPPSAHSVLLHAVTGSSL